MTSEALDRQLQLCYTARARPKRLTEEKCFSDDAWTELESYSTEYQCSETSRQQVQTKGCHAVHMMGLVGPHPEGYKREGMGQLTAAHKYYLYERRL